jgi:tRNA nucleotidyltransferase (CCA-adding enzyme)
MTPGQFLDGVLRDLVPTEGELSAVQRRVDDVVRRLPAVAEVHPAGSWTKGTMLRGRKEADIVVVLSEPPDGRTLDDLAANLAGLGGLRRKPDTSFKAVQLEFEDGVLIDLLPVAKDGRTPDGPSVPRKLRHALAGVEHVQWLKQNAHGSVVHPVIRLMKHFRDMHKAAFHGLSSFAIEVLCVEVGTSGDLAGAFQGVLRQLADGFLLPNGVPRRLADPARPQLDLVSELTPSHRADIQLCARRALDAMSASTWSQVFPRDERPLPPPAANLGGRTLG